MFFRLLDADGGECIGEIRVPGDWGVSISKDGRKVFRLMAQPLMPRAYDLSEPCVGAVKLISIERAHSSNYRDGVVIFGCSPEEMQDVPGCWFSPSIAYMRRILAAPVEAPDA